MFRQLRLLPYLVRREVCTSHWIQLHITVLYGRREDRAQSPLEVLKGMERLPRGSLQVEERLYRFDIDLGQRPITK